MSEIRFVGDGPTGAFFSECRQFRYTLWRRWHEDCSLSEMCAFVGLNPSTADETADDPTIRRCIGFAKSWGFGGLVMLNLFAFRSTDPEHMKAQFGDPTGDLNDQALSQVAGVAGRVVCAWGKHGSHRGRSFVAKPILVRAAKRIYRLALNGDGSPKHPLYVKGSTKPVEF